MRDKNKDDIVALLYRIDKSQSISKTKSNAEVLFDYIQQLLDEREVEELREKKRLLEELLSMVEDMESRLVVTKRWLIMLVVLVFILATGLILTMR
jgi:hypothetical protein